MSACGGSDCSKSDVDGSYLVETTEIGGNCGEIGSLLVRFDSGEGAQDNGCSFDRHEWSDDECKEESSITCVDTGSNRRASAIRVLTQSNDGKDINGTLTMTIRNLTTGELICNGTYSAVYTRQ